MRGSRASNRITLTKGVKRYGALTAALCLFFCDSSHALDVAIKRVSNGEMINREPKISSEGLAAWAYYASSSAGSAISHLATYDARSDQLDDISLLLFTGPAGIDIYEDRYVFVSGYYDLSYRRPPKSGPLSAIQAKSDGEEPAISMADLVQFESDKSRAENIEGDGTFVWSWRFGANTIEHMPAGRLSNVSPSAWKNVTAWQWEQTWPFGYEIMVQNGTENIRLTDDKFYDLNPKVYEQKVVWYGWDGYDYEIFLHDLETGTKTQLTDNRFDDIGPQIWDGVVVWEGYPGVEADIFMWKDGEMTEISDNLEDDLYPRIWDKYIVWQGFDGDDYEIYIYDHLLGGNAVKMTSNNFDDANPEIKDGIVAWLGYHDNWDSEIYAADLSLGGPLNMMEAVRLTDNDHDDLDVDTAGRRIIWVTDENKRPQIMLAEPR